MLRPDGKCKICDRVFETDFSNESAQKHYHSKTGKVIASKFMPCLHAICCDKCSKAEKYMECPFCENQIKKVVYNFPLPLPPWSTSNGGWKWKYSTVEY